MTSTPLTSLLTSFDVLDHPGRVIERIMSAAREHLGLEVSFVTEFEGGQRIFRYTGGDVQRFQVQVEGAEPLEDTYCQQVVAGTMGPLVPDARNDPAASTFAVTEELGVAAYVGVPVRFSDGQLYGTLCCLGGAAAPHLSERDVVFMRMAAALVAEQLERLDLEAGQRHRLVARIRSVIDDGGMATVYQPIVDLETRTPLGFEALTRFTDDPGRGPTAWFDEAWLVGLGAELELAAVRTALRSFDRVPDGAYLAVNLSPETLLDPALDQVLDEVPPGRLVVEVTEHARVLDYTPVRTRLDELRARGIRIAIDDLGTGHAGVNHLLEFRPEIMKIDLSITRGIRHDRMRRAIAATFAAFAASVGIDLVAEGIETAEDHEALEILGLQFGQGYHIAPPAPLAGRVTKG